MARIWGPRVRKLLTGDFDYVGGDDTDFIQPPPPPNEPVRVDGHTIYINIQDWQNIPSILAQENNPVLRQMHIREEERLEKWKNGIKEEVKESTIRIKPFVCTEDGATREISIELSPLKKTPDGPGTLFYNFDIDKIAKGESK